MGRATRWLKSLFTSKKSNSDARSTPERKKWGLIGKSFRQKGEPPPQMASRVNEERRGSYGEVITIDDENEQNKRAIAVAAATAAVAEAAVAAAHAAAAVVRLTSSRRCVSSKREEIAAIKIQSAFRGYLAKRALRALRGLVKLQALVRGNIVRKQAAETLRCMHSLVRVQVQARACRAMLTQRCRSERGLRVSPNSGPPTPEKSEQTTRSNGSRSDRSSPLMRNSTKSTANSKVDRDRIFSSGRNWLDRWIEEKYYDDDKNTKILEIDSGKPKYSKESPSKDSTAPQLSPSSVASPQFYSATSFIASSRRGPFTPTKSECSFGGSSFRGYSDHPNYMANTESFRAKSRSHSAPRQRPDYEKSSKRIPVSSHGPSIQAKFANKAYPGSGRLDRLGVPVFKALVN